MSIELKRIIKDEEVVNSIFERISKKLDEGKKVLLFLSGGSSIPMEISLSHKLKEINHTNLIVTLADERYVPMDSLDSNWFSLISGGFDSTYFRCLPFLKKELNLEETANEVSDNLGGILKEVDYKIGVFGIGADGHTAGMLPHSIASTSSSLVCGYDAGQYKRITITERVIKEIDEAFIYAMSKEKWPIINSIINNNLSVQEQPAQALKEIKQLTIFTSNEVV